MSDALIRRLATQLRATGQTEAFIMEVLEDPEVNWSKEFPHKLHNQAEFLAMRTRRIWRSADDVLVTYAELDDDRLTNILEADKRGFLSSGQPFRLNLVQRAMLTRELEHRGLELLDDQNTYF